MSQQPSFSVIIPTHKRAAALRACLESLLGQNLADGFEVLVVYDGGGSDAQRELGDFCGPLQLTILRQDHMGPARARNLGASRARGKYLAFLDDDCRAEPGWLQGLLHALQKGSGLAVGGVTHNGLPRNPYAATSHFLHERFSARENFATSGIGFIASNNFAVPAWEFRELGGFAEFFKAAGGEDRDFCRRWLERGGRLAVAPQAGIRHYHEMNLKGFWRQHMTYGQGAAQMARGPHAQGGKGLGAKLAFSLGLILSPWRDPAIERKMLTSLLCLASQVALLVGYTKAVLVKGSAAPLPG